MDGEGMEGGRDPNLQLVSSASESLHCACCKKCPHVHGILSRRAVCVCTCVYVCVRLYVCICLKKCKPAQDG